MPKKQVNNFRDVSPQVNSDALEREILAYWEKEKIFEKSLVQTKDKPLFTFYDGPPYATGKPHYGHVLQSAIKDTVLRYQTMRGRYVPRRVGWDTHGLPIENIVEKELGFTSKRQIEEDIEGFNAKCREVVYRYVDEFTGILRRMGRWADYEQAFSTLDRGYMESEWWVFRQLWDRDLVYKAFRSTPYCIRCATPLSNFEVSMAYRDTYDKAVYVFLPVSAGTETPHAARLRELPAVAKAMAGTRGANQKLSLLVWTTTPWTLPANVAVAYHPDIVYVVAEYEGRQILMARDRVAAVLGKEAKIVREVSIAELKAMRYQPIYNLQLTEEERNQSYGLVEAAHVTADNGTGLVHMAPAFGEEDHLVAKKHNLPIPRIVDGLGNYVPEAPHFAGENIFEANGKIIADLKERGLLLSQETYKHSYPFCWRCDTPLIYYALDTWFVRVQALKERMLKINKDIHWIPEHVKEGRFAKGIESAPDWAVSRNRFWSVPVPIWECDVCGERVCVGSVEELQKLSGADGEALQDLHRPFVDRITWECAKCSDEAPRRSANGGAYGGRASIGMMQRLPEVLDVWFDSGSMPYAQWHYPFENKAFVERGFPADFIGESIEMTRAWFYVLHVLAAALTQEDIGLGKDSGAYRNVIASGLIFAEDGRKLSKKLKNYPEIGPTLERYGADALRMYLLTSASLGEPYRFSEKDLRQVHRNVYMTLWNVYSFFVRYALATDYAPGESHNHRVNLLDSWMLARTAKLEQDVRTLADDFQIDQAARQFIPFVDDLSNWYVRRSRSRFHVSAPDKAAFATLHEVLLRTSRLLAPFMPFLAEEMYRNLAGSQSVHLEQLPDVTEKVDAKVLKAMALTRTVVSEGLALRAAAKLKVRQPLAALNIIDDLAPEYLAMIADELNVKAVRVVEELSQEDGWIMSDKGSVRAALNIQLTPGLVQEGLAREIIRYGQGLRRQAGYALSDRIVLVWHTDDAELAAAFEAQAEHIRNVLQADEVTASGEEDAGEDLDLGGRRGHLGVRNT